MTTKDQLTRADDALAEHRYGDALVALLDTWRETRDQGVAGVIDKLSAVLAQEEAPGESYAEVAERGDVLDVPWLLAQLTEGNAAACTPKAAALLKTPADPRIAARCLAIFSTPPWHATGSQPFYTALAKVFEKNAEPRVLAPLEAVPDGLARLIRGEEMLSKLQQRTRTLHAAMSKIVGGLPRLSKQEKAKVQAMSKRSFVAAAAPVSSREPSSARASTGVSERELFAAVHEAPNDDERRAILADLLSAKGDPRGEFIALQLAREKAAPSEAAAKREMALVKKHQAVWLGEAAPTIQYKTSPHLGANRTFGFSVRVRWRRGFLTGAILQMTGPQLKKLATSPLWSTLDQVSLWRTKGDPDYGPLFAAMPQLTRLDYTTPPLVDTVAKLPVAKQLQHLEVFVGNGGLNGLLDTVTDMPALIEIHLRNGRGVSGLRTADAMRAILDSPLMPQLIQIRVDAEDGELALKRLPEGGFEVYGSTYHSNEAGHLFEVIEKEDVRRVTLGQLGPNVETTLRAAAERWTSLREEVRVWQGDETGVLQSEASPAL